MNTQDDTIQNMDCRVKQTCCGYDFPIAVNFADGPSTYNLLYLTTKIVKKRCNCFTRNAQLVRNTRWQLQAGKSGSILQREHEL